MVCFWAAMALRHHSKNIEHVDNGQIKKLLNSTMNSTMNSSTKSDTSESKKKHYLRTVNSKSDTSSQANMVCFWAAMTLRSFQVGRTNKQMKN
jgi:hypothetical protein